jgi:glycosyltransferase involved in cell wall biosynthesis
MPRSPIIATDSAGRWEDARVRVLIVSNLDSSNPFGQFLRPFHLGRGLARLGVRVVHVGVDCRSVEYGPSASTHAKSLRQYIGGMRLAARRERPDVVYGHEARGGAAAILAGLGLPVVVDYHALPSVEWAGYARTASGPRRALYAAAAVRSAGGEQLMARRADAIVAAGQELADDLVRLHRPSAEPVVVPNGVGEELLSSQPDQRSPFPVDGGRRSALATMPAAQSEANVRAVEFLVAVAERLAERDARVGLHVLGSDSGPQAPGLRYEGFQDSLHPWIAHADVCLLPYPDEAALAGGPRNKLLEYLALGRTIVTTREGLRGLRDVADWPGVSVTSDDPGDFAAAVAAAAEPGAANLEASRARVREELRWDVLAERVRDVLAGAVELHRH